MTVSNSVTEVSGSESSQHFDDCRRKKWSGRISVSTVGELGLQEPQRMSERKDSLTSLIILESGIQMLTVRNKILHESMEVWGIYWEPWRAFRSV